MDTIVDVTSRLAARIRAERQTREWSRGELAERAGISRAMVAKIEAGQSSPTAMLLGKLSGAFGITMSTLLARSEAGVRSRHILRSEQSQWRDPTTGYVRRQVFPVPGSSIPIDMTEVTLPPGARLVFPASSYVFIRQLIWMLRGTLTFFEGDTVYHLQPGDCLELGAPGDCRFENAAKDECVYVVVVLRREENPRAWRDDK